MLELQINQKVGLLNWNFEQLNEQLDIELKRFDGVVVTEEQITEAKKARANLNALAKAINDRKIQVKKEFCAPYLDFESKVKILTEKIKNASSSIDVQIKNFDEQEKQQKRREILRYFEEINCNLVNLNQIFDEKWLNKGCSEKTWKEQLSSKIENIKVELAIIDQMEVEDKRELKSIYLEILDISKAKQIYDQRELNRAKIKASEQEKQKQEQEHSNGLNHVLEQEETRTEEIKEHEVTEELYNRAFRVIGCTRQQIIDLGNYMNAHGIRFEKINM